MPPDTEPKKRGKVIHTVPQRVLDKYEQQNIKQNKTERFRVKNQQRIKTAWN